MPSKQGEKRSKSNYDECTVHLLSAFFCVTGAKPEDELLRKAIENVLVDLGKAESCAAHSNVVQFCRRALRAAE